MVGIRVESEVTILEKGIKKTGVFSSQFGDWKLEQPGTDSGEGSWLPQTVGGVCAHTLIPLFCLFE